MFVTATAAATASLGIKDSIYTYSSMQNERCAERVTRYNRWRYKRWLTAKRQLSHVKPEAAIQVPSHLAAQWLPIVQDRIERSILPKGQENDGRWITPEIAAASSNFFEMTSDLLPGEPYIYRSSRGDLVAEFEAENGRMTGIITPDCVGVFVVAGGIPIERKIPLGNSRNSTRHEMQVFAEMLHTKQHGAVETRS